MLFRSCSARQVREQLQWADVFLHAAVSEGFCNAVLEAQAAGIPVVCSDADGLSENVADGITGFVVPRRSWRGLAEKLQQLADDPELRAEMGAAGRRRVERKFRPADQIERFADLYRQVLDPEAPDMDARTVPSHQTPEGAA